MAFNINNIKGFLQIEDDSQDKTLKAYIPAIEDYIKNYCNNDFLEGYPPAIELIAAKMIQFNLNVNAGFVSKTIGDASENYSEDYPPHILNGLKVYKKAKFL